MLPSGLGGASSGFPSLPNAANGAAHLLPVPTGGPAGQAGEQPGQPGAAAQGVYMCGCGCGCGCTCVYHGGEECSTHLGAKS
eukprot:scaffold269215_cov22-Tisochrysis_lutea.AAC.1